MISWLRKMLRIKSDRTIIVEVAREPTIKEARKQLKRVDRILQELEALEGKRT